MSSRVALLSSVLSLLLLVSPALAGKKKKRAPAAPVDPATAYADVAAQLFGWSMLSEDAFEKLVELCDGIGPRLSGSPQLEQAIRWAAERMKKDGLSNVRTESVQVPKWVRGEESLTLLTPAVDDLPMLGLGLSIGTPPEGIEAEVVVVSNWEELEQLGEAGVSGRIVLYNVPFTTYGETVAYRGGGANRAAVLGAKAVLVRSVGPVSLSTPHTGAMRYDEAIPKIPAAAISIEGATRIQRLTDRNIPVRVRLTMQAKLHDDVESANVIGEVTGSSRPEEIVVIGCHLDSWDVGTGAQDDGAGCVAVMEAARLIGRLDRAPARTVRVVLFTNEENGLAGGRAYANTHAAELEHHIAALEMDTGSGQPLGFRVDVRAGGDKAHIQSEQDRIIDMLKPLNSLLRPTGATEWRPSYGGADIGPTVAKGVLGFGVHQDTSGYWPIHHTEADTIDKIDPLLLNKNVAAISILAYVLADWPDVPRVNVLPMDNSKDTAK